MFDINSYFLLWECSSDNKKIFSKNILAFYCVAVVHATEVWRKIAFLRQPFCDIRFGEHIGALNSSSKLQSATTVFVNIEKRHTHTIETRSLKIISRADKNTGSQSLRSFRGLWCQPPIKTLKPHTRAQYTRGGLISTHLRADEKRQHICVFCFVLVPISVE